MSTIDFGWWVTPRGQRCLLCWHPHNGQVVLHHPDLRNEIVGVIYSEPELRRRLDGWADHCDRRDGLGWLAGQLDGAR